MPRSPANPERTVVPAGTLEFVDRLSEVSAATISVLTKR